MKLAYTLAELAALGGGSSAILGGVAGYKKGKETDRPISGAVRGALGAGTGFLAGATGGMFAGPDGNLAIVGPAGAAGAFAGYKGLTAGMGRKEKTAQVVALFDELEKLGAVSTQQAQRALDRLDVLEKQKPDAAQVGRYSALGAGTGALGRTIGYSIEHGKLPSARSALGAAAAGAVVTGAVPLLRSNLDQRAEMGKLKKYVEQPGG